MLKITLRSASLLSALRRDVPLDFSFREAGKLVLLRSREEVDHARRMSDVKRRHGCPTRVLDQDETLDVEPAIAAMRGPFAGAVYSDADEVADAAKFCRGLADWLQENTDTRLRMGQRVRSLLLRRGRAVAVETSAGMIDGDAFVVCLGARSPAVLRPLGIAAPIYPVRGYSVTLPAANRSPVASVTDPRAKIVFSRLNGAVRIAGFADFVGFDSSADDVRVKTLIKVASDVAPEAAHYAASDNHAWGGFRPMTPGGPPLVGGTRIPGLFMNTGHGMLGWTMACATAHDVAAAVGQWSGNA